MEFNADGSLKIGGIVGKKREEDARKMETTRCVKVTKNVTRSSSPKLCTLSIVASPLIEPEFVERTFALFAKRVDSTVKLEKVYEREYNVTIGGEFSRCRDCQTLMTSFRMYLEGNFIENKGTCTFKGWSGF